MIKMKLVGGLGNQLFQWACARNLQNKYGHYIEYIDHIELSNRKRDIYRFPKILMNDAQFSKPVINKRFYIKDSFRYDLFQNIDFSDLSAEYLLDGYWQGEKYFIDVAQKIKEELQPSHSINIPPNSLSLHIRRTDYLHLQDFHPVQPLAYYESAVDLLNHTDNIYVFSDDIDWCKENLKFNKMTFIHNKDPLIDLWMMSACDKNVIANSTFSWWAAWINKNPNKKVICPKKWFGDKSPYSDIDILDNDWIKI